MKNIFQDQTLDDISDVLYQESRISSIAWNILEILSRTDFFLICLFQMTKSSRPLPVCYKLLCRLRSFTYPGSVIFFIIFLIFFFLLPHRERPKRSPLQQPFGGCDRLHRDPHHLRPGHGCLLWAARKTAKNVTRQQRRCLNFGCYLLTNQLYTEELSLAVFDDRVRSV